MGKSVVLNMAVLVALILVLVMMNVGGSHGITEVEDTGPGAKGKGPADDHGAAEGAPNKGGEDGVPGNKRPVPTKGGAGVPIKKGGDDDQQQHRPAAGGHHEPGAPGDQDGQQGPAAGGDAGGPKKEAGPGAPAAPKGKHDQERTPIRKSGPGGSDDDGGAHDQETKPGDKKENEGPAPEKKSPAAPGDDGPGAGAAGDRNKRPQPLHAAGSGAARKAGPQN